MLHPDPSHADTQRLKIEGWRKIYQPNEEQKTKTKNKQTNKKQELQFSSLIKQTLKQQRPKETKKDIT